MPHPARPKNKRQRVPIARRDTRSKAEVREDRALTKFVNKHKDILTRDDMAIPRFREASTSTNTGPINQTIEAAAQTDTTATFIVSKDTLVAYTIAVIQQTNDYHFGQMSIVIRRLTIKT